MENKSLAKTEKEKTIKQHTDDLIYQYNILKDIYPDIISKIDWDLLKKAVFYHDLGKVNSKFQNKLYKKLKYTETLPQIDNEEEIPHNFLSPLFIDTKQLEEEYGVTKTKILLSAVYYHHDREEKQISKNDIEDIKKQAKYVGMSEKNIKAYSKKYVLNSNKEEDIEILEEKEYIQIKGLLNRIDHIASLDKEGVNIEESIKENNESVADKIKQIIKNEYHNSYREVQSYMMEKEDQNLVVISYTGSGKTEAALLWIGENKGFYTLPLKVSINAMYQRIKQNIQYHKTLLLHSDAYSYYRKEENDLNLYDRARRMSSPLIITTIDQLFKIVFRYRGYEEILSTLSYSKIVIDEIQMYSPELIAYILLGLSMITKVGGKFAIITATFPTILYDFMDYLKIPYIKQVEEFKPHIMNRHRIHLIENQEFDYEKIKKEAKNKKVLIIVNTIKRAQEIYRKLEKEKEKIHLLHSHYLKKDRDVLEKEILEFGDKKKNEETGIWISTQIVEASLDIDFDILFTEMCSADSLFQRMGRVYRKRLYQEKEANIHILDNRNGVPYIIDSDIYDYTLEQLKLYQNQDLSESDKQKIIKQIFSVEENKDLKESNYYKKIKNTIRELKDIRPNQMPQKEINDKFRNIQNVSLIPDNIYDELERSGKIDKWNEKINSINCLNSDKLDIKDELKKYIVDVRWNPKLEKDTEELFFKGSNIYRTRYYYDFNKETKTGLGLVMENMKNVGYFDE